MEKLQSTSERMLLNIQLFAEGEGEGETTPTSTLDGGEGAVQNSSEPQSLDDLLASNKDFQKEFDRRITKSLETAKAKWQTEYDAKLIAEKNEAEKLAQMNAEQKLNYELKKVKEELKAKNTELNSISLYKEASNIAKEKGLPIEYLDLIDFGSQNAESINTSIDKLLEIRNRDLELSLRSALREQKPMQRKSEREKIDPYIAGFNSYFE